MEERKFVHTIDKGYGDEVKFSLGKHRGRNYFDVRIFFEKEGNRFPTKKGLTLAVDHLDEFKQGLERISEAAMSFTGSAN